MLSSTALPGALTGNWVESRVDGTPPGSLSHDMAVLGSSLMHCATTLPSDPLLKQSVKSRQNRGAAVAWSSWLELADMIARLCAWSL